MKRGELAFWWLLVLPLVLLSFWGLYEDAILFLKTTLGPSPSLKRVYCKTRDES